MSQPPRNVQWIVWGGLGAIVLGIVVAFFLTKPMGKPLPVYGEMISFSLTNQNGQSFTLANLEGQVWVADAIFTRCPGQCLTMSAHMKQIQDALPSKLPVQLVSFSTDPANDTSPVLKKYAAQFKARDDMWTFLTGPKSELHNAEIEGLKLAVVEKEPAKRESADDLFLHSEKFVLLDKQGRIRGWFDGDKEETPGIVVAAVKQLLAE